MAHDHSIVDSDIHFIIDATSRKITPASPIKNKLMQLDHNSERFTFEVPRYIEGHDMSLCDSVQVHYRNAGAGTGLVNVGVYEISDVAVSDDTDDIVQFSWLISQNATQYGGKLSFVIKFICLNNDIITYSWGTDIYDSITIGPSMNYSNTIVAEYADILEQWRQELFNSAKVPDDIILVDGTPTENTHMLVETDGEVIEVLTLEDIAGLYTKPNSGIPESDLSAEVRNKLDAGGGAEVTEQTVADWGFTKFDGNYNSLSNKPTIPDAVTSATVSGWGFAKSNEIPAPVTDQHIIDVITAAFPNAEGVGF